MTNIAVTNDALAKSTRVRAFTLVELLVVVAIIAILVAILIPVLTRARDSARTAQCASNMREISHLIFDYASLHDGRGPGNVVSWVGGTYVNSKTGAPSGPSDPFVSIVGATGLGGSIAVWPEILTNDLLERNSSSASSYGTQRWSTSDPTYVAKTLTCPNGGIGVTTGSTRQYMFNGDAGGGSAAGTGVCGPYGIMTTPALNYTVNPPIPFRWTTLGAKLSAFGPSQFILMENTSSGSSFGIQPAGSLPPNGSIPRVQTPPYGIWLGDDVSLGFPAWTAGHGAYAFRHTNFKKGNFAYFDGHVDELTPDDEINSARRMSLGG